jgi:hypothetical protein
MPHGIVLVGQPRAALVAGDHAADGRPGRPLAVRAARPTSDRDGRAARRLAAPRVLVPVGVAARCAVRVLTHELAHVADIRRRGRVRAWRAGASAAEAFASRVARATARVDSALGPTECAGADG